jgi:hypothetical protein
LHGIQPAAVNSQKVWKIQEGIGIVPLRQFTVYGRSWRHKYDGRVTFAKYGPAILHRRFPVADRPEDLASLFAECLQQHTGAINGHYSIRAKGKRAL